MLIRTVIVIVIVIVKVLMVVVLMVVVRDRVDRHRRTPGIASASTHRTCGTPASLEGDLSGSGVGSPPSPSPFAAARAGTASGPTPPTPCRLAGRRPGP